MDPEFYETDVDAIPITLPFPSSHLRLPVNNTESLSLQFDFRSNKSIAILAASNVTTASGRGYWEVHSFYIFNYVCPFTISLISYIVDPFSFAARCLF